MSLRERDTLTTPSAVTPLTRREARELENPGRPSRPAPRKAKAAAPHPGLQAKAAPRHHTGSKLLSLGAMLFAGAILVGTSIPANAFMSDASAVDPGTPVAVVAGQSLEVSGDALLVDPTRDTFDVISYADQLRLKYGNVSYSFAATTGAIRWPFPYAVPITDGFGDRPAGTSGTSHHNGVDFVPGAGTPIYAVADGVVKVHGEDQYGYGNHVILSHDVNGLQFDSVYAHMQTGSSPLTVGDTIKVGDFIGLVGDTGASYGAHLHFEIRLSNVPVDPFAWLTANAVN